MEHTTRSLEAPDGIPLHLQTWSPSGPARFVVVCVHGQGEHGGRYAPLAEELGARGGHTIAIDHRGHGRSGGQRGHVTSFETYTADLRHAILDEAARLPAELKPQTLPWFLFGHSMGGLITLMYLLDHEHDVPLAGAIVSAPLLCLAMKVNPITMLAGKIAGIAIPRLPVPSNIPLEALSRDAEQVERYRNDPLRVDVVTAAWFNAMNRATQRVERDAPRIETPLLVYHGTADKVCQFAATEALCKRLKRPNQSFERWDGYYHELHNETESDRRKVVDRFMAWMDEQVEGRPNLRTDAAK